MFTNKVLAKICGAKREEITGKWRKLHNAELHALYPSRNIIWNLKSRLIWGRHAARMEQSTHTDTQTQTHTHTYTHIHRHTHRHTHTHIDTYTPAAHFISLFFFKKETRLKMYNII